MRIALAVIRFFHVLGVLFGVWLAGKLLRFEVRLDSDLITSIRRKGQPPDNDLPTASVVVVPDLQRDTSAFLIAGLLHATAASALASPQPS